MPMRASRITTEKSTPTCEGTDIRKLRYRKEVKSAMYNSEIQELLEKHYGSHKSSLTIGSSRKSKRTFYYAYNEEILSIRDALNGLPKNSISNLAALVQSFDEKECSQCACYSENDRGEWQLHFYKIQSVNYHKSVGNKVAATLILSKYPVVSLSENAPFFYGVFERHLPAFQNEKPVERVSYWVNKNIQSNIAFRGFAADFFSLVGEAEKKYILKDVGRTILHTGCFLPSVGPADLIAFHNPRELNRTFFRQEPRELGINLNLNKLDINTAWIIAMITPRVSPKEVSQLDPRIVGAALSKHILFEGLSNSNDSIIEFCANYIANRINDLQPNHSFVGIRICAWDYVRMALELQVPIRLYFSSYGELVRQHDRLAEKLNRKQLEQEASIPLLRTPSVFDALEQGLSLLDPSIQRIRDLDRLMEEGATQNNCVVSYRDRIRKDIIAIFSWDHYENRYTIEFSLDDKGRYVLAQIKGKDNQEAPRAVVKDLLQMLERMNYPDRQV